MLKVGLIVGGAAVAITMFGQPSDGAGLSFGDNRIVVAPKTLVRPSSE